MSESNKPAEENQNSRFISRRNLIKGGLAALAIVGSGYLGYSLRGSPNSSSTKTGDTDSTGDTNPQTVQKRKIPFVGLQKISYAMPSEAWHSTSFPSYLTSDPQAYIDWSMAHDISATIDFGLIDEDAKKSTVVPDKYSSYGFYHDGDVLFSKELRKGDDVKYIILRRDNPDSLRFMPSYERITVDDVAVFNNMTRLSRQKFDKDVGNYSLIEQQSSYYTTWGIDFFPNFDDKIHSYPGMELKKFNQLFAFNFDDLVGSDTIASSP